ncbi:MAG: ATP-binding protein [Acidobacteriia bacterium]|nr:ATP-binding protein [Terriglobia bacterium]
MSPAAIYGRDAELEQLRQLVSLRHSFLLHGPAGVGKTLLLKQLAVEVPEMLYCDESSSSQLVFRRLAARLFATKNRHVLQACGTSGLNAIKQKSAVSIRGIVTEALREANHWIVLDHLKSPSQSFAAALKDVCSWTTTPLIAVARSAHMEDVGFLLPMFPDRSDKYALRNFDSDTAREFAARTAQEVHLSAANRDEAIQKIVHYSKGNPGAIVAMLHMAASPKYVTGQHVKLSPLYIDFRLSWGATHA